MEIRRARRIVLVLTLAMTSLMPVQAITPLALGDSLTSYMKMPTCVPKVKVKSIQQRKGVVTIKANEALSGLALDAKETKALKNKAGEWVTGQTNWQSTGIREVRIYSGAKEMGDLIVDHKPKTGINKRTSLEGAQIALWASHGRYYYSDSIKGEYRWVWQRAKMWNTIEDRLTTEITTRLTDMLENAGATVLMPRPDPRSEEGMKTGISGLPKWMEGAVYWLREQGMPESVTNHTEGESEYKNDLFCRPKWVNYMVDSLNKEIDYTLAIHTDGYDEPGDENMVGTLAMYSEKDDDGKAVFKDGRSRTLNRQAAHMIQRQLVNDMKAEVDSAWPERRLRNCSYVETRVPKVPSMILEIASHKDITDAQYLLDPSCQDKIARATYKGLARALCGYHVTICPLAPKNVWWEDGVLSWEENIDELEPSAKANYYIITDNRGHRYETKDTKLRIQTEKGVAYEFRVRAVNGGGKSAESTATGVYNSGNGEKPVLIVNAFDRVCAPAFYLDSLRAGTEAYDYGIASGKNYQLVGRQTEYRRELPWVNDDDCGWGMCTTEWQEMTTAGNTHDYHLQHAEVLKELGRSYVAVCTVRKGTDINSAYSMADVIYGQNTEKNATLDSILTEYHNKGGYVTEAGAYIGDGAKMMLNPWNRLMNGENAWKVEIEPNEQTLYCNTVKALKVRKNERVVGFWRENGLPAIVKGERYVKIGCMLESVSDWKNLYKDILQYEKEEFTPAQ